MVTYLQGSTKPDISIAVHQAARFFINPKISHERAVKRIGHYLFVNKDRGIIFKTQSSKGVECYVDADFAVGWSNVDANNADCELSRTGFALFYAGCPICWASRLQTEITLSTAESEYVALSTAMREVISSMHLMNENDKVYKLDCPHPKVLCKLFKDNESYIAVATTRKCSPHSKHNCYKVSPLLIVR